MEHWLAWAGWLEASALGEQMRSSALLYPLMNLLHLLGLVMLVGSVLGLDLRLLGVAREFSLQAVSARLTPVAIGGLMVLLVSGFCQFAADAASLVGNSLMQTKMWLLLLGVVNAGVFRFRWRAHLAEWDANPPTLGRLQVVVSMLIWLAAMVAGRSIAYF